MRRRPAFLFGCLAAASCLAGAANAEQHIAVTAPLSAVPGDPALAAQSPGARGDGTLRALLLLEHAYEPLVLTAPSQNVHAVVADQLWLGAAASYALSHRWLAALHVPLLLWQSGQEQPFDASLPPAENDAALGDPRLTLRGRLLGPADGFALGAGIDGALPLATAAYAGAGSVLVHPFLSAGHESSSDFSAMQLGFTWRKSQTLPGILPTRLGSSLDFALAAGVALDRAHSTRVGPELSARLTVGSGAKLFDARSTSATLLVHLEHRLLRGPFTVALAFGPSLGRAPGTADFRALLGLSFSPQPPVPPPDGDEDTVPDSMDMCPSLHGEPSSDPLMHGCPPLPADFDGDGVPDSLDACPKTVGEPNVQRRRHGCPKLPEPAPPPAATLEASKIHISEQVQFETGTALLRPESGAILTQVVEVLRQHPEIELCEVAGHTDDTGSEELNLRLSQQRAQAVLEWLAAHGIARGRLKAEGYGTQHPIGDNTTEDGRAKNRRVEFVVRRRTHVTPEAP
ncbi:MAG TPA: OmpA family protein [Polyangiaceae bacterium]|nr:OmpA family protein [Polyangiaceae bacterium]